MRSNLGEERAAGFCLLLGAFLIGIALGEFLYTMIRNTPPPYTTLPAWQITVALVLTVILIVTLRKSEFRLAFLSLAVVQGLILWKSIGGPWPTLWFIQNTVSLLAGVVCVWVSAKKNGRTARIVAPILSLGMIGVRYFSLGYLVQVIQNSRHHL